MHCTVFLELAIFSMLHVVSSKRSLILPTVHKVAPNTISALSSIICTQFATRSDHFTITVTASNGSRETEIKEFVGNLLKLVENVGAEIEVINKNDVHLHYHKQNLVISDGGELLFQLNSENSSKNHVINAYYLIYLYEPNSMQGSANLISDILKYFWKHQIINACVLYEVNTRKAELYTFYPFDSEKSCRQAIVKRINTFTGYWHNSTTDHIFPLRIYDLKQCPLKIVAFDAPPSLLLLPNSSNPIKLGGIEGELFNIIADKLNCSLKIVKPPENELRGLIFENGTATGAFKMLQNGEADFTGGAYVYLSHRMNTLTAAYPYYQTIMVFSIVLSRRRYSSFEILSMVFDINTWVCIFLTLPMAMILVHIVHRLRNFSLLARLMTNPSGSFTAQFGVVSIFLGAALSKKPSFTFTRFIVFCLFVWGIILRTAYQTLLFSQLQTSLYEKPPATYDDLLAKNYKLVLTPGGLNYLLNADVEISTKQSIIINRTISSDTYQYLLERPNQKLVVTTPLEVLYYFMLTTNVRDVFYVVPEQVFTQYFTIYFPKLSYLVKRFDFILMSLRGHGILKYWFRKTLNVEYLKHRQIVQGESIRLPDLWAVFVIIFALWLIAILIFLCEIFWVKYAVRRVME